MTDVRFYHLTRATLETALPRMLQKTLERGQRALVMAASGERVEALNAWLWSFNDRAFLPHGSAKDGHGEHQPVWLTVADEAPNDADVLFLTDGATSARLADYERCAILFDGKDEAAVAAARAQWQALKGGEHEITYWQQDDQGRWNQND